MASKVFTCRKCGSESRWFGDTLNPQPVPEVLDPICANCIAEEEAEQAAEAGKKTARHR